MIGVDRPSSQRQFLAGPNADRRSVIAVLLVIAALVLSWWTVIARFEASGEVANASFQYFADLTIAGSAGSGHGLGSSDGGEGLAHAKLALERAEDVRAASGAWFVFWVLIGAFVSARPGIGPKAGLLAGAMMVMTVLGARNRIEDALESTRWTFPVTTSLEMRPGYWFLLALTLGVLVLNAARLSAQRRDVSPTEPA